MNAPLSAENEHTGEVHGCATPDTCASHKCAEQTTLAPDELNTVVELIPDLSLRALVALHDAEPNLLLNVERQAVQVLGCQGLVLASVELTPWQKTELGQWTG